MGLAIALLTVLLLVSAEMPGHRHEAPASVAKRLREGKGHRHKAYTFQVKRLPDGTPAAVHKIRHVVVIMQENRSFDSYFGTYPGADGIPGLAGNPGKVPCIPDPLRHNCQRPYHDTSDRNAGGPHGHGNAVADIAGGKMNGFIRQAERGRNHYCKVHINDPRCSLLPRKPDVMGYHDWREIPNYWDYASHFVLQDHMFQSDASWSLPEHLYLVSGWSAKCTTKDDPMSCHSAVQDPVRRPAGLATRRASRRTTPGPTSPIFSTGTE